MSVFVWTGTGVYPAGGNAWNGQPLAVAPAGTFWTPNTKPAAENWNFILAQIASNLANVQPYTVAVTSSGAVAIPSWATWFSIDGCGQGGGGGGGPGGEGGTANQTYAGGGGGAAAQRVTMLFPVGVMTNLYVQIGAASNHGLGGAEGVTGGVGGDGLPTTINSGSSFNSGTIFASFAGGAGGGAGNVTPIATSAGVPVFSPGGTGPAGLLRGGPASLQTQTSPGPSQALNLYNTAGAISVPTGTWPAALYNDPVGPIRRAGDGGASVANCNSAFTAPSYAGCPSKEGNAGGAAGAAGAASGIYPGGAGGGGGGGGGFYPGGAGGAGGAGATSGLAANGFAGASGPSQSGAGGGGGGAGGNSGTASDGGSGGAGGDGGPGQVILQFFGQGG